LGVTIQNHERTRLYKRSTSCCDSKPLTDEVPAAMTSRALGGLSGIKMVAKGSQSGALQYPPLQQDVIVRNDEVITWSREPCKMI
jgi:hypothetical protein